MKYDKISKKILKIIYNNDNQELRFYNLLDEMQIESQDLHKYIGYLKKKELVSLNCDITGFISDNSSEEYKRKHQDIIMLTKIGTLHCEQHNKQALIAKKHSVDINILSFSKNNLQKNNLKIDSSLSQRY